MKRTLVLVGMAACVPPTPDLPNEVDGAIRTFALANTHTAVLTELDPSAPDNVRMLGTAVPEPTDEEGNSLLVLPPASDITVGQRHACVLTPIGEVSCWGDNSAGALGE